MKNRQELSINRWLRGGMLVFFAMSFLPRGVQAQEFGPPEVTVKSGPEQLTVEWNEVEGATGYKVQWRNPTEEWDASRQAMEPETSLSNLIEDLDPAITYEVRVFAKDMYGDYSYPSDNPTNSASPTAHYWHAGARPGDGRDGDHSHRRGRAHGELGRVR